ncbi:MAG: ribosome recycling factor [Candidatus Calescibacterium sp.]|jgi:ribosome recycling factor|nr:ribosome recycling factor [Candidatus Calescibacterium sp.]
MGKEKEKGKREQEVEINPDKIISDAKEEMKKAVEKFDEEMKKIKTGRAHPSLLDGIKVFAYDSEIPLNQLALISVSSPSELIVEPFDPNIRPAIEKAILQSGRDLVPQSDGKIIRIKIPPLTQETRENILKLVRKKSEDFKVSIRNIRDKARSEIKDAKDKKVISEDRARRLFDELQKITDENIKKIDTILQAKEKEILG